MPLPKGVLDQWNKLQQDEEVANLTESMLYASQGDSKEFRRADKAATEGDIPFSVAVQDVGRATKRASRMGGLPNAKELYTESPETARWLSDPRRAAISMDDVEVMRRLEKSHDTINTPINWVRGLAGATARFTGDIAEFVGRLGRDLEVSMREKGLPNPGIKWEDGRLQWDSDINSEEGESALLNLGKVVSERTDETFGYEPEFTIGRMMEDPTPSNVLGFIAETAFASFPEMAASTLSPPALVMAITERLAEQRQENMGNADFGTRGLMQALPSAVAVAAIERFATRGLLGKLAEQTGDLTVPFALRELGTSAVREGVTEVAQEELEYATEALGTPVGMNAEEAGVRALGAVVAGAGLGAGARAVTLPLNEVRRRVQKDTETHLNSVLEQQSLDTVIRDIQGMQLFQESPERAGEFLAGLKGNNEIYLNPDELLAAADEGLNVPTAMLEKAREGVDVGIPVSQFAMEVMTDDALLARLRPHIKRTPESLTQQEIQNRDSTGLDRILEKARTSQETLSEAERIHDEVTSQLVATGRLSEENARASASIIPAYVTTKVAELRGRGTNVTVEDIYRKLNFRVESGTRSKGKKKTKLAEIPSVAEEAAVASVTEVAPAPTSEQVVAKVPKAQQASVGAAQSLTEGQAVDVRPQASQDGVWWSSVSDRGGKKPTAIESAVRLTGATLEPQGTISGKWAPDTPEGVYRTAQEALNSEEWVQVGLNLDAPDFFYDRLSRQAIVGADEVIQIGDLTLAKNPRYGDPTRVLTQESEPGLVEIQNEISALEQLLACTRAG